MRYLFSNLSEIEKIISNSTIFLLLDYDGTLTRIRKAPEKALINPRTKNLLNDISKNGKIKLAVISGRALPDIKSKISLSNIIYSGNHGLEISGPKIKFKMFVPKESRKTIGDVRRQLKRKFSSINGVIIEDKGFGVALHFRQVYKRQIPSVKAIFNRITGPYLSGNKIMIKPGKMVFDVRPAISWDKGKAVLMLLKLKKRLCGKKTILPVYIGDDKTDEDAFSALKSKGITVFVGKKKKTNAKYYLNNTGEVLKFLRFILDVKKGKLYA
ncbi:MAG: trehalose-phosphatase [Candidatus Omnitrophica bacterium]|nr:trehalose-phosphatase [Candidatus Omnitrophota bacterium]